MGTGATTSDGGKRISQLGSLKKSSTVPMAAVVFTCLVYGGSAAGLTFVNKQLYTNFEGVSLMNLLMVQSFLNVVICLAMMTFKEMRKSSFSSLRNYGIVVPQLNKILDKAPVGLQFGAANFATIFISMSALKLTSIPL